MNHLCHTIGCKTLVPPKFFCCKKHWFEIPPKDRKIIWNLYKPGQEISKNPSREYLIESNRILIEQAVRLGQTEHADYRIALKREKLYIGTET